MKKLLQWIREQFVHVIPVVLFFLVIFSLVHITEKLMRGTAIIHNTFLSVAFAALVMGKIVAISNHFPWIGLFSGKPLIWATLWKTAIYMACTMLIRIIEWLLHPLFIEGGNLNSGYQNILDHLEWLPFWVGQMWLGIFLLIFVAYAELVRAIGKEKVCTLFFYK